MQQHFQTDSMQKNKAFDKQNLFWTSMKTGLTPAHTICSMLMRSGSSWPHRQSLICLSFFAEIFISTDAGSSLLHWIINSKEKEKFWSCFCFSRASALRWQKWSLCWTSPPLAALGGGTLCRTSWGLRQVWTPETSLWNWRSFPSKVTWSIGQ